MRCSASICLGLVVLSTWIALTGCEGDGADRPGFIVQNAVDPRCTPIGGAYPSGLDQLPGDPDVAVVMRFDTPAGLLAYDIGVSPPRLLTPGALPPFPADSDGDGVDDALRHRQLGLCPSFNPECVTYPDPGSAHAAANDLVLVTTSDYEQVLFYEPMTGRLRSLSVANPLAQDAHDPDDWPFLPAGGTQALRTAVSSRTCAYPPVPIDSLGDAIVPDPLCDPTRSGYLTRFTAASLVADGWLFVATSNLRSASRARFQPGTVLVYALDTGAAPPSVAPDTEVPVVFTTGFNPTGLTLHRNASGRALVLVTLTGPITAGGDLLGAGAVDVIDVLSAELVATIPLGDRAAPSFGPMAIDPSGQIALLGAESHRQLYAIDLRPLDDPALYAASAKPVVLDGGTPGFPDARIFDAGTPLTLPDRPGGPPRALCAPRTNVAIDPAGELGYATDWCDGSIHVLALDLNGASEQPLDPTRIQVTGRIDALYPKNPDLFGLMTAPSMVRTTPPTPLVDPDRPDIFFVANEPESQLCSLRVAP
ncbi:MAG: hypothetical protein JRH17_06455 [Deltaproteobacteria bacterium]|nr:hypothetical protein [Deltaproteobacteria bacterium]